MQKISFAAFGVSIDDFFTRYAGLGYSLDRFQPKPNFGFRILKEGAREFHTHFVLAPADKASNNVVVV